MSGKGEEHLLDQTIVAFVRRKTGKNRRIVEKGKQEAEGPAIRTPSRWGDSVFKGRVVAARSREASQKAAAPKSKKCCT